MRKPIRNLLITGTAGVVLAGGSTAAALAATSDDNGHSRTVTGQPAPRVSEDQAQQTARQRLPGATITETELEHEHGRTVWEIDLVRQHNEYEVTIDAATGNVLSVERDDDDGDGGGYGDD